MPVPSLPPRPSRDGDALSDRHPSLHATGDPAAQLTTVDADAADTKSSSDDSPSPALLPEHRRGSVAILKEARDRAGQIADNLAQLKVAGDGLTRVHQLVGRLHDVAVVALDRSMHPANRATLQREVDRTLSEIDAVADETLFDDRLLLPGGRLAGTRREPFLVLETTTLGIAGLAVRSSDQALAAAGALDVATARLERSANAVSGAATRLQGELASLTSPATTVDGQPSSGSVSAAFSATILLRARLEGAPYQAAQAQAGLDDGRAGWLLDSPPG